MINQMYYFMYLHFLLLFYFIIIILFLASLGLCFSVGASSGCRGEGLLFVVVHRLLVAEHLLLSGRASVVRVRGLACPAACEIILDQG